MSVRDLSLGQLEVVFHGWLGTETAADFGTDTRLLAWRHAVEQGLEKIRTTSAGQAPDLAEAGPAELTTTERDRRAEAAVRSLAWAMSAAEQAARSTGDSVRGERLAKAFGFVFDRGMRFLANPLFEQVGETRRLVTLARHESVMALMADTVIAGADWDTLVTWVEAANQALDAALSREIEVTATGPSARLVRIESVRLANLVAQTAGAVLPQEVADRFLAVFRREVARAAARRAGQADPGGSDSEAPADTPSRVEADPELEVVI